MIISDRINQSIQNEDLIVGNFNAENKGKLCTENLSDAIQISLPVKNY